jgi:hypothetical protein
MPPRNREGAPYQDARYAGHAIYDPILGVGGPYLYSFESKLGGVYHKLKVARQVKTQSFEAGCEIVRPEGRIRLWTASRE